MIISKTLLIYYNAGVGLGQRVGGRKLRGGVGGLPRNPFQAQFPHDGEEVGSLHQAGMAGVGPR